MHAAPLQCRDLLITQLIAADSFDHCCGAGCMPDAPLPPAWLTRLSCLLQDITLAEALTGTSFNVNQLDKRVLVIQSPPGEVIKPDSWRSISDEGMPVHGRPMEKGNLYVRFTVQFPETLGADQLKGLKSLLPGPR